MVNISGVCVFGELLIRVLYFRPQRGMCPVGEGGYGGSLETTSIYHIWLRIVAESRVPPSYIK